MFGGETEQKAALLSTMGMRPDIAHEIAAEQNNEMGRCVLALYRSAAQPAMRELGERLRSTARRPGLVIIATADPYAGTPDRWLVTGRSDSVVICLLSGRVTTCLG